jgi:hypothetical protein
MRSGPVGHVMEALAITCCSEALTVTEANTVKSHGLFRITVDMVISSLGLGTTPNL